MLFKGKELYIDRKIFPAGTFCQQILSVFCRGTEETEILQSVPRWSIHKRGGYGRQQESASGTIRDGCFGKLQEKVFFPFSTVAASPDGSGWYCMPRPGDQVRIFFPTADEKESYAIANIQGDSSPASDSPMSRPDLKDITMPDGKAVRFIEGGIQLAVGGNKGTVTLTNDGNAEIVTDDDIEISAAEAVCFSTDGMMSVTAGSGYSLSMMRGEILP